MKSKFQGFPELRFSNSEHWVWLLLLDIVTVRPCTKREEKEEGRLQIDKKSNKFHVGR